MSMSFTRQPIIKSSLPALLLLIFSSFAYGEATKSSGIDINPLSACRFGPFDSIYSTTIVFAPQGWRIINIDTKTGHLAPTKLPSPITSDPSGESGYLAVIFRDYRGLLGTNQNWERVAATLEFQSITTGEIISATIKRIHKHQSIPYLVMEIPDNSSTASFRFSQIEPKQAQCDKETLTAIKDGSNYATPAILMLVEKQKGNIKLSNQGYNPIGFVRNGSHCDCFSSYKDTLYGYTLFVAPDGWTILDYNVGKGRDVVEVPELDRFKYNGELVNSNRAIIVRDVYNSEKTRSQVILTFLSNNENSTATIGMEKIGGKFHDESFIGKPILKYNVKSLSANINDMQSIHAGPKWDYTPPNSTRKVGPKMSTFYIETLETIPAY